MPIAHLKHSSRLLPLALLAAAGLAPTALAQLRVCNWNITNYSSGRIPEFQTSIYGVVPATSSTGQPMALAGQRLAPDIIIAQELLSQAGINNFVSLLNSAAGSPGDWSATSYIDAPGGDTSFAMFYRTSRVLLVQNATVISAGAVDTDGVAPHIPPRNTERYRVRLVGYNDIPTTNIFFYNSHMKSGSGVDELRRGTEAQRIVADIATLPAGTHAILGGDFNVTGYNDEGFLPLIGGVNGSPTIQNGPLYDPIRALGTWENSNTYRFIHTQDPGVGKQMDSRFDFVLISNSLRDGVGMDYIGSLTQSWNLNTFADPNHSYRCWGNDGSSYNVAMNVTSNVAVGNTIAAALQGSAAGQGHLPVFLDLRVPAKVALSATTIDFGAVPQGSTQTRTFTVSNSGDVTRWTAAGIASLNYTVPASGGPFSISPSGAHVDAAGGGVNTHTVTLNTSTPGSTSQTITITTGAPEAPTVTVTLLANVQASNPCPNPSNIAGANQSTTPDDQLTADDIIVYLGRYFASDIRADVAGPNQSTITDGQLSADDIIVFLSRFFTGC